MASQAGLKDGQIIDVHTPFADMVKANTFNDFYEDCFHPNIKGYKLIAERVKNAMFEKTKVKDLSGKETEFDQIRTFTK